MKKIKVLALAAMAIATLSSCYTSTTPIVATSNPVGNKCGEASTTRILFLFGGSGNMGLNKAVKNGGITKISHVDFVEKVYLGGLYTKSTTFVYGE